MAETPSLAAATEAGALPPGNEYKAANPYLKPDGSLLSRRSESRGMGDRPAAVTAVVSIAVVFAVIMALAGWCVRRSKRNAQAAAQVRASPVPPGAHACIAPPPIRRGPGPGPGRGTGRRGRCHSRLRSGTTSKAVTDLPSPGTRPPSSCRMLMHACMVIRAVPVGAAGCPVRAPLTSWPERGLCVSEAHIVSCRTTHVAHAFNRLAFGPGLTGGGVM